MGSLGGRGGSERRELGEGKVERGREKGGLQGRERGNQPLWQKTFDGDSKKKSSDSMAFGVLCSWQAQGRAGQYALRGKKEMWVAAEKHT